MAGPARRINQQVVNPLFLGKSDDLDDLACRLRQSAVTRQPITAVTVHNFKMFWRFHVFLCGSRLNIYVSFKTDALLGQHSKDFFHLSLDRSRANPFVSGRVLDVMLDDPREGAQGFMPSSNSSDLS
jgi:hypothetical protein